MRVRLLTGVLAVTLAAMGFSPVATAADPVQEILEPGRALPDLAPAVTFVEVGYWYHLDDNHNVIQSPPNIRFSVSVQNTGQYALDLLGDASTDLSSTTVQQCVSWTARLCRERVQVGGFAWHPEHNHFHFQDFATYELRRLRRSGRIDWHDRGLIQVAPKVSFCLMDTQPTGPDAPPQFYSRCLGVNQGISPGWEDVYDFSLPGQGLSIEGLPDGQYGLVVRLDPNNRLYETDDTDNLTALVVEIYEGGTQARIVGPAA